MTDKPDTSMNVRIIEEFRANAGKAGPWESGNILLLHTIGAKSGEPRLNPVGCFRVGGQMLIVGSYAGADMNPPWVHNLRANPRAHIEIGTESYDVVTRELPRAERDLAYTEIAKAAPTFAEYETKTKRVIPVFELQKA